MTKQFAIQEATRRTMELGTIHYVICADMLHRDDMYMVTTQPCKRYDTVARVDPTVSSGATITEL